MVKPNDLKDKTVDRPLDENKVEDQVNNLKEEQKESDAKKDKE
ncbi:hypothetical protein [Niallia circulans]|nr:hypothetical protein [Niallia circulans]